MLNANAKSINEEAQENNGPNFDSLQSARANAAQNNGNRANSAAI